MKKNKDKAGNAFQSAAKEQGLDLTRVPSGRDGNEFKRKLRHKKEAIKKAAKALIVPVKRTYAFQVFES